MIFPCRRGKLTDILISKSKGWTGHRPFLVIVVPISNLQICGGDSDAPLDWVWAGWCSTRFGMQYTGPRKHINEHKHACKLGARRPSCVTRIPSRPCRVSHAPAGHLCHTNPPASWAVLLQWWATRVTQIPMQLVEMQRDSVWSRPLPGQAPHVSFPRMVYLRPTAPYCT